MRRAALAALALAALLVGSTTLVHPRGAGLLTITKVETRLGALAPGSAPGADWTNGSAALARSLTTLTTSVLWLNNTNATAPSWARLDLVDATGLATVAAVTVGIQNGTASVAQVEGALGAITEATGTYVRLEPGSANAIYVTHVETSLLGTSVLAMELRLADDAAGASYSAARVRVQLG